MKEIFKDIQDYEGLYQISNLGNVKSLNYNNTKSEKLLKKNITKDGYLSAHLHKNGKSKNITIHRLVANAFIDNPQNKPEVNHKFGIKIDNRSSKLEWCTHKENVKHDWKFNNRKALCGEKNNLAKLKEYQVIEIRNKLKNSYRGLITKLSKEYNLHRSTIRRIKINKIWKNV